MKTNELRHCFLEYFASLEHTVVPSAPLIPPNDPTLLFTNAGMVPFKEVFLGKEHRSYTRATSAQRCVRAGGKHNDLENVGYTARHHTFFEMLGNFSFGDYFKSSAIQYAWDFLTKVLKLPPERLWITVFKDDLETEDIWLKKMKVSPSRFSRSGEKDNFWSMGDTGPCGPCTEIFYDHGPDISGGPPGSLEQEGDRYVEIWNLVFMQYNRSASGILEPLPKPSVDTGMGLERIAAVMQGVSSNYEIDLFQHLLSAINELTSKTKSAHYPSQCVLADHIRSTAFLIADGIYPSNEGRGYVLRRIIRRALRHGSKLGLEGEPYFYRLLSPLVETMGDAYPELVHQKDKIAQAIKREEELFSNTLTKGLNVFNQEVERARGQLSGEVMFRLYDTYGFPPDLTADMARERHIEIDHAGFEAHMAKQRKQSQQAAQFSVDYNADLHIEGETTFTGYERTTDCGAVIALLQNRQPVTTLKSGDKGAVVLDKTPFYAESGGQVGDKGSLTFNDGEFTVQDTQKCGKVYLHIGTLSKGTLTIGDAVNAQVDSSRQAIMLNHTATHLLHAALRRILGDQVVQKGSLVEASRLRFDFAYHKPLTAEQIQAVEQTVNQQIRANLLSTVEVMNPDEAIKQGALALFGEKYGERVRVLRIGEFSKELCGGTHVKYTGEIGAFKIINETAVASGIRRLEALSGESVVRWMHDQEQQLQNLATLLKTDPKGLLPKLTQQLERLHVLEKSQAKLAQKMALAQCDELIEKAVTLKVDSKEVTLVNALIEQVDRTQLRHILDQLKTKLKHAIILLAGIHERKIIFVAAVSPTLIQHISAKHLMQHITQQVDGKGGGRADSAQGGGNDLQALPGALDSLPSWVESQIK